MKFSGKMRLMIILKVTKSKASPFLWKTHFWKNHRGAGGGRVKLNPPAVLGLRKGENFVLRGTVYEWVESYLTNRRRIFKYRVSFWWKTCNMWSVTRKHTGTKFSSFVEGNSTLLIGNNIYEIEKIYS